MNFIKRYAPLLVAAFLAVIGMSMLLTHGILMAVYHDDYVFIVMDLIGIALLTLVVRNMVRLLRISANFDRAVRSGLLHHA